MGLTKVEILLINLLFTVERQLINILTTAQWLICLTSRLGVDDQPIVLRRGVVNQLFVKGGAAVDQQPQPGRRRRPVRQALPRLVEEPRENLTLTGLLAQLRCLQSIVVHIYKLM